MWYEEMPNQRFKSDQGELVIRKKHSRDIEHRYIMREYRHTTAVKI